VGSNNSMEISPTLKNAIRTFWDSTSSVREHLSPKEASKKRMAFGKDRTAMPR
jgi:hypothetical protein